MPINVRRRKYQVTEAAKRLGVSRTKLWKMIKNKEIAARPDPLDSRKKLIDEADIDALLERRGIVQGGNSSNEGGDDQASRGCIGRNYFG